MPVARRALLASLISLGACTGSVESPFRGGGGGVLPGIEPPEQVEPPKKLVVPEPLHRLNRDEYDNTVRELLGTTLTPARAFPPDTAVGGFDNAADALTIPASLFSLYADAAKELADDSLTIFPRYQQTIDSRAVGIAGSQTGAAFEDWGWTLIGNFNGTLTLKESETVTLSVPLGGGRTAAAPTPVGSLFVDGAKLQGFTITAPSSNPQTITARIALAAGSHQVTVSFDNRMNEPAANEGNQMILGPIRAVGDATVTPITRSKVYVCEPVGAAADTCYDGIVALFAERAWRRPLTLEERTRLVTLFHSLAATEGKDPAVALMVRAILVSPKFLFRVSLPMARAERPVTEERQEWVPLDDYVLASRLSYFLWSSMPDDQLFAEAATGALRTDEGLKTAVRRMLADPKAQALRTGFGAAWLGVKALNISTPDPTAYPGFTPELKAAMADEAQLFFDDFLRNGKPLTAMLNPDFGYLNDTLSAHYQLPVRGNKELMRVTVGPTERRGILMQGAWLTSSSDPTHTSPVRRGRWVLEQLLGKEIPPPPPGIPPLPTDSSAGTVRERLAVHREDPMCASCHNVVDPVGLGLEEFDGIGTRRELENEKPVDKSGAIDGAAFNGADEMAVLLEKDPRFLPTVIAKLHTYAMGRAENDGDKGFVVELQSQLAARGNRLDDLIELIVLSPSFRMTLAEPLEAR